MGQIKDQEKRKNKYTGTYLLYRFWNLMYPAIYDYHFCFPFRGNRSGGKRVLSAAKEN